MRLSLTPWQLRLLGRSSCHPPPHPQLSKAQSKMQSSELYELEGFRTVGLTFGGHLLFILSRSLITTLFLRLSGRFFCGRLFFLVNGLVFLILFMICNGFLRTSTVLGLIISTSFSLFLPFFLVSGSIFYFILFFCNFSYH
jgi:hypothetical protein